ncbi:MAG: hypothetical protein AAF907_03510 [Planctomycetota bacterium]
MFRLLSAALLTGSLLFCGSVVRGTMLCDWDAALEQRACPSCHGTVTFDPTTFRAARCRRCEATPSSPAPAERRVALR